MVSQWIWVGVIGSLIYYPSLRNVAGRLGRISCYDVIARHNTSSPEMYTPVLDRYTNLLLDHAEFNGYENISTTLLGVLNLRHSDFYVSPLGSVSPLGADEGTDEVYFLHGPYRGKHGLEKWLMERTRDSMTWENNVLDRPSTRTDCHTRSLSLVFTLWKAVSCSTYFSSLQDWRSRHYRRLYQRTELGLGFSNAIFPDSPESFPLINYTFEQDQAELDISWLIHDMARVHALEGKWIPDSAAIHNQQGRLLARRFVSAHLDGLQHFSHNRYIKYEAIRHNVQTLRDNLWREFRRADPKYELSPQGYYMHHVLPLDNQISEHLDQIKDYIGEYLGVLPHQHEDYHSAVRKHRRPEEMSITPSSTTSSPSWLAYVLKSDPEDLRFDLNACPVYWTWRYEYPVDKIWTWPGGGPAQPVWGILSSQSTKEEMPVGIP